MSRAGLVTDQPILHLTALTPRGKLSAGTLCNRWVRDVKTLEREADAPDSWRICKSCESRVRRHWHGHWNGTRRCKWTNCERGRRLS